ncbi:MAG TPA: MarR family winged helix-turn-helix transcriptional regulator [Pseudonocardiaceae bacterium]|nr:MarR family winged helix-turn-helix transcriptional regulator [Pseudonocardiaceae bacterium]
MEVNSEDVWLLLSGLADSAEFVRRGMAAHPLDPLTVRLLTLLAARPGLRPTEAAELLGVAPPTVTRHVQDQQALGRLRAVLDDTDRRSYRLEVTEEGLAFLAEFRSNLVGTFAPALERLSGAEVRTLAMLLARLVDGMAMVTQSARAERGKRRFPPRGANGELR